MGFLNFLCNKNKIYNENELPWNGFSSIYSFIEENIHDGKLPDDLKLPDDERRFKLGDIQFVAGGLDGAFGHHGNAGGDKKTANKIVRIVKNIALNNNLSDKVELYKILASDNIIDFIDPTLEKIFKTRIPIEPYLHNYANWLAKESPDRGPVKFGIALLGLIANENDIPVYMIIGKHEEFTLYATVAISNTLQDPTMKLWELAKNVNGWGKIHIVEKISKTSNSQIKEWLLLEGYKNNIMYEYLAYPCAIGGELHKALSGSNVNIGIVIASSEIISALITGGPAQDINDYEYAQIVIRSYLEHANKYGFNLTIFNTVNFIREFLSDSTIDLKKSADKSWNNENRKELAISAEEIIKKEGWVEFVQGLLSTNDETVFWEAKKAASYLNLDISEIYWSRLIEKPHESGRWFDIMSSAKSDNIDRIITFALKNIPLDSIATGPSLAMGVGSEYNLHNCLDFILQEMGKFPNKGIPLIEAGLKSPVIRNRNMALNALESWGKANWSPEIVKILSDAYNKEPDEDVKKFIKNVIEGKKNKD